jgi:diacylglycerol kinase (ATP)
MDLASEISEHKQETWLLVINPVSGGKRKEDIVGQVESFLAQHKIIANHYYLTGFQDKQAIKQILGKTTPDKAIAIGGDGTCNLLAICLLGTGIPMGTIPAGSANGMALDLGIPIHTETALKILINNKVKHLDILRINEKYYSLHLSDAGLNAQLIYRFEHSGRRGKWSYFKEMIRALFRVNTFGFHLTCNDKHYRTRAVMLAFANASRYGSGAVLNPGGKPDDRKFEICIVRWFPWYRIPALAWHFFKGDVNIVPEMRIISTDRAYIRFKRKVLIQADGEILGHHKHLEVVLEPGVIPFVVP